MTKIKIAIGEAPISKLFLANETRPLNLLHQPVTPIHHAFRPMVEKMAFDVSEMAIVTAIQAVEQNRKIVPLPITVWARLQHISLEKPAVSPVPDWHRLRSHRWPPLVQSKKRLEHHRMSGPRDVPGGAVHHHDACFPMPRPSLESRKDPSLSFSPHP